MTFDLRRAVPWYVQRHQSAKEALARAQEERVRFDLAVRRKAFVPADTVEAVLDKLVTAAKTDLLGLPSRLKGMEPNVPGRALQTLGQEIRRILSTLAGHPVEDPAPAPVTASAREMAAAEGFVRTLGAGPRGHSELLAAAAALGVTAWALTRSLIRVGWVARGDTWILTDRARPWLDPLVTEAMHRLDQAEAQRREEEAIRA